MRPRPYEDDPKHVPDREAFARLNLVGDSASFQRSLQLIRKVSPLDVPVLISGETGTGKELAARAIHHFGTRRDAPFLAVNCGAIPDSLVESEFFGHTRGAFTDAKETRDGLIAQARGGTLFLDELEALSEHGQVALLRFLQDRVYRPLGGPTVQADVRVIGATNVNLSALAAKGAYRTDLLFRLSVLLVDLPPLRAREGDVLLLAEHFLQRFSEEYRLPLRRLAEAARAWLSRHDWPGNVRELENLIHREFLLSEGPEIALDTLSSHGASSHALSAHAARETHVAPAGSAGPASEPPSAAVPCFRQAKAHAIAQFERAYVTSLLQRTRGNISLAARLSGKDRRSLGKLVKRLNLARA
jgi:two-component system, NtrC family, response regulator GlrR